MGEFKWSPQQEAVFALFCATVAAVNGRRPGPRHVVVRARAGTGKTTTIIELVKRVLAKWPRLRVAMVAFNARIAEELKLRLPPGADGRTYHSLGLACLRLARGNVRVDADRDGRLALAACGEDAEAGEEIPRPVVTLVAKLANLGKDTQPLAQGADALLDAQAEHDLYPDPEHEVAGYDATWIRERAYRAMVLAEASDGTCAFSDMVYLPVRLGLIRPTYDMVVVDEAQDTNAGQLLLAQRACKPGGRIVVVGDDRQAIYGFRGADAGSIDRLKGELEAAEVPLTVTRRCPKAVVALAREIVPDFEAADEAPEGVVESIRAKVLVNTAKPGDFILSRTNAPLVTTALAFARQGVPVKVEGRDLGKGLVALIEKAKSDDLTDVMKHLERWEAAQLKRLERLSEEKAEKKAEEIGDKVETIRALAEESDSTSDLIARIEGLFSDGETVTPKVVLSTVHKAKGLEAKRVFLLKKTFFPKKRGNKNTPPSQEELNIRYVAITRAQHTLTWVEE